MRKQLIGAVAFPSRRIVEAIVDAVGAFGALKAGNKAEDAIEERLGVSGRAGVAVVLGDDGGEDATAAAGAAEPQRDESISGAAAAGANLPGDNGASRLVILPIRAALVGVDGGAKIDAVPASAAAPAPAGKARSAFQDRAHLPGDGPPDDHRDDHAALGRDVAELGDQGRVLETGGDAGHGDGDLLRRDQAMIGEGQIDLDRLAIGERRQRRNARLHGDHGHGHIGFEGRDQLDVVAVGNLRGHHLPAIRDGLPIDEDVLRIQNPADDLEGAAVGAVAGGGDLEGVRRLGHARAG